MAVEGTPVKPVAATSAADIELKGTRERKDGEKLLKGEHVIWEGTTWPMCCCSPLFCCTTIWTITNMKIDKKHGCCWMKEDTTDMRRVTDLACAAAAEPEKSHRTAHHARAAAPPHRRTVAPPRRRAALRRCRPPRALATHRYRSTPWACCCRGTIIVSAGGEGTQSISTWWTHQVYKDLKEAWNQSKQTVGVDIDG